MTKQELLARLTRDPIVVQRIATLAHYRIALHDDPNPSAGVWLGLAGVGGTLLVEDYEQVYARVNGKVVPLTYRETEAVVSRLRTLLKRGGSKRPPLAKGSTVPAAYPLAHERRARGRESGGRT